MIVIPMMGRSSRFFDEGYQVPKYELPLAGKSVLDWVVLSFSKYFDSHTFLFIVRKDFSGEGIVKEVLARHGVKSYKIVVIEDETKGQAETVALGLKALEKSFDLASNERLAIFNADSFMPGFSFPSLDNSCGNVIDVFKGAGDHWSFVEPGDNCEVLRTTEKVRISDLCSNGLYIFESPELFLHYFAEMEAADDLTRGEYYVAPLYNYLIRDGVEVTYRLVKPEDCIICGTPEEYENLVKSGWPGF